MRIGMRAWAWAVVSILTLYGALAWAEGEMTWPNQAECLAGSEQSVEIKGWCLAIDRSKGNCLACHALNIKPWPNTLPLAGNIGPPLERMQKRFADIESLRAVIEDATVFNQRSSMPPYLKHGILDADEINLVVQFLWSI